MLWVLIRSASVRHFQWEPTVYVFVEKLKKYQQFLDEKSILFGPTGMYYHLHSPCLWSSDWQRQYSSNRTIRNITTIFWSCNNSVSEAIDGGKSHCEFSQISQSLQVIYWRKCMSILDFFQLFNLLIRAGAESNIWTNHRREEKMPVLIICCANRSVSKFVAPSKTKIDAII